MHAEKQTKLLSLEQQIKNYQIKGNQIRNLNKKVKLRDTKICKLEKQKDTGDNEIEELNNKISGLTLSLENKNTKVFKLTEEKSILSKKLNYLKMKLKKDNNTKNVSDLRKEINELSNKVATLDNENKELNDLISLLEDSEIVTFQDGRFSNDIREVIMELLSLNVSMAKVNEVIKVVITKLAKKTIGRLPSVGSRTRIMGEALILAQRQVADAMLENNDNINVGNCLHGDGTTKYHKHYQNFQITTKSGKLLSFGLSEIASGDAASTLQCFVDTIDDICDVLDSEKKEKNYNELICSIRSTMSDLGPVNPLFNTQLKALIEELLPKVVNKWDSLNLDERKSFSEMANFFCKLHLLANFATETDKVLKSFEKIILSDSHENVFAFNTRESGATRLIRTACKAFHSRGSDEAGVAGYFDSFLAGQNKKSLFVPFIGNRFNILYYNAAALYFHFDSICSFLNSWPNPNHLLKAVKEDVNNSVFLAEARALGIVDKLVTGPLWRIIEDRKNILEINPFLFRLKLKLSDLCKDASPIFSDNHNLFNSNEIVLHRDELYEKLFENTNDTEFDVLTQQALEIIFHALLIILERQCVDQLPGLVLI